ncbi:hypothetical protein L228DRAFT_267722 [Xylona heveae TC161]|uniref:C2H2-type domain-containing protein n=1 Tax=Xylona heveae (strain CBS 132557 / TC161) TaxID=1328760 RepID=A0A165HMY3_XYLHT|nr:hypothetical protein L228DRAFT_267722 [Xylona heveae TC161]KZF23753.1 hypothetical protein L228DRAFT_267722 [Xylona heveae TC161]
MDTYQPNRSPVDQRSPLRSESRYTGRDDTLDRPSVDSYRRRSPGPSDRRTRGRGRSRSPVAIDRYLPDSRSGRDDHYTPTRDRDDRRRASPPPAHIDRYVPGQDTGKPAVRVNPLPNPLTLDFQVGFNWFAEWWRVNESIKEDRERQKTGGRRVNDRVKGERESREEREKEKGLIQAAYDAYKEELQVKLSRSFVQHHKGEEWFKERYLPEVRDPFRRRLTDFRRGNYSQWEQDLDSGIFDEFTLEGIYKSESNGQGGIVEKEEGETTAVAEVLQVGDLLPVKGGDVRDESAFQPALLIKTIAPTVSREKIEEFCKEHLGEQDGGFRWLSLSDPNPLKKCHRIGWVMLHPSSEQNVGLERGDGRDEEMEEAAESNTREEGAADVNVNPAEKALEAINGKTIHDEVRGDFTCHVGVHVPPNVPRKKALWDLFSAPERIDRDLELASRLASKFDEEFESEVSALAKIEDKVQELKDRGLIKAPETSLPKVSKTKKEIDLDADGEDEEGEAVEAESEEEGTYDEDIDDEDTLLKKKKLDLLVEYLRRVFNFCFFCVFESDSVHELTRKCPGGHLRRPRASLSSAAKEAAKASAYGLPFPFSRKDSITEGENGEIVTEEKKFFKPGSKSEQQLQRAFNWVKTFEDKILQIVEPENVDLKKIGGKPVEDAAQEEMNKYVKQEDEAKFRCKIPECTKLFKADYFWRKHVEKRHADWFENLTKDLTLVNAYCLDPARIGPGRPDASSNGHFPAGGGHMPAGTPRGFSLANMPMNFGFGMAGSVPSGFPPFMAHHPVQAPGGWNGLPPDMGGGDDRHLPGPMRRGGAGGGGRYGARSGPYDRRQNPRDARWNAAGRLSPPRGGAGARPAGPGKWGDGGAAAVGPREAVQGRSLKSYEDLDAVDGGGAGDLNY